MSQDHLYQEYKQKREELIKQTRSHLFKDFTFSETEQKAEKVWAKMLQADRHGRSHTYYQVHTLKHKTEYMVSDIYKVVEKFPKGATLHIHSDCCVDNEWFLEEIAYNGKCYLNQEADMFAYFETEDKVQKGYRNLQTIRDEIGKIECDKLVLKTLNISDEEAHDFSTDIWSHFEKKILSTSNYMYHKENFRNYLDHVLRNFIKEGIIRVEGRHFQGWMRDSGDNSITAEEEFEMIGEVVKGVQKDFPHFTYGVILQGLKVWDQTELMSYYRRCFELRKKFPELIVGFDLVQEEDGFKTTLTLAETLVLKEKLEKEFDIEFPFYLHGGESADSQINTNLYDCILLGTKRIGHGINLIQHTHLIEEIKKHDICLELCPSSNQVLRYYPDIRNHPLKGFLNAGVKCSISPDDPGVFGVKAVNHDFYFACIGARLTFQEIKQLVHNSIFHSACSKEQKQKMWEHTEGEWNKFIDWFVKTYDHEKHHESLNSVIGDKQGKYFL